VSGIRYFYNSSLDSTCCLDEFKTFSADTPPSFVTCETVTADSTATCLNNLVANNASADFNFPVNTNDFFRYQHRSCLNGEGAVTSFFDCGDRKVKGGLFFNTIFFNTKFFNPFLFSFFYHEIFLTQNFWIFLPRNFFNTKFWIFLTQIFS